MEKCVAFFCLLGFALSVVVDFRPYDHSAELLFNGSDFNHDGIFSRDELEQEFKKYDADGEWTWPFVLVLFLFQGPYCTMGLNASTYVHDSTY